MTVAASVRLDLRIHPLTAVKKAAYRFGGRCHVSLEMDGAHHVKVSLRQKNLAESSVDLGAAFEMEVLDQGLREEIGRETEAVRNVIIAQAFSQTSLLDPEGEEGEPEEDPLEIARPDVHGKTTR